MNKALRHFKLFLWYFSHFKVPLIGQARPKLIKLNDEEALIKIPLTRKNRNHLHSMYFGALAIGADVAAGLHGYYFAHQMNVKISLAFKSFQAQFLSRPEADVFFSSNMGQEVQKMITHSQQTGTRVNKPIAIKAFVVESNQAKDVAHFTLELSLKVL